jgi:hypothetical protein
MAKKEEKVCCDSGKCETAAPVQFKAPTEVSSVTGCKPCSGQILLELLTVQEMMGTKLFLKNSETHAEYQAYVLAMGPAVDARLYGFQVGDRVLLSGNGTPVPNYDNSERERILMDPYCVKAVLV